ncbi:MAG: hypothetical protein R3C12_15865 [Planctomycetaceae bacterium]
MGFSRRVLLIAIPAGALLQIVLLLVPQVPLGIPGEWTWSRTPTGTTNPISLLLTALLLTAYLLFLRFGSLRISAATGWRRLGWCLLLWLFACMPMWSLRGLSDGIYGHAGLTWVTYYPRMSGYFTQASQHNGDLTSLLRGYENTVREGDYLHQGTHPPGLPIYFSLWLKACRASPGFRDFLLSTQPLEIGQGLEVIEEFAVHAGVSFGPEHRAVLWGNVLLTHLLTAATVLPLFLLTSTFIRADFAWWLSGLWPLCPGLVVFMPKSDVLFPLVSMLTVGLFLMSVSAKRRTCRIGLAWLAGLTLWLGLLMSLALLVVAAILACWCLLRAAAAVESDPLVPDISFKKLLRGGWLVRIPWDVVLAASCGILLPCLGLWWLYDLNLATVWRINLAKHGEFYDHNTRNYLAWLLENPLELAFSLGGPLFVLTISAVWRFRWRPRGDALGHLAYSVVLVWVLLWLSGKNMGESARLWIFLFPLILLVVASQFPRHGTTAPEADAPFPWLLCGVAQALVAGVTVASLDGFDYSAFPL